MAHLDDVRQLVERFHLFSRELEKSRNERTQRLKTRLDAFWPAFLEARKTQARLDRDSAPAFNVFRLLDLERAETVHTQFLADLLNPSGTHGQGVLFLEHFLSTIHREDLKALLPSRTAQVWVTAEFRLDSGKRPDLALSCPHQFFILIENKIRSDASEGQLQNYRDWLDRYPALDDARRVLVFLTVHGVAGPDTLGDRYTRLSYLPGVKQWLTNCLPLIGAPRVEQVVTQYLQTVGRLHEFKKEDEDDAEE